MRHILWIPMGLVGLLLLSSLMNLAGSSTVLQSMEFILLVLVESVLFGAWVIACEVAANRKDAEGEQIRTRNLLRELHGTDEGDEAQASYGGQKSEEQMATEQKERAEREAKLDYQLKDGTKGPKLWIAVVVVLLVGLIGYAASLRG